MKKKHVLILAIIVLGFCVLMGLSGGESRGILSAIRGQSGASKIENSGNSLNRSRKRQRSESTEFVDPRVKSYLDQRMSFLTVGRFDDYLQANARSPRSLLAVFSLTGDHIILSELKQHLDVPEVLLFLSQTRMLTDSEKLKNSNLYIEKRPDEMQGYMLAASIAVRTKESDEKILELVKNGMAAEKLALGYDVLSNDMRDALKSSGMDDTMAEIHLAVNDHQAASLLLIQMKMLEKACDITLLEHGTAAEKNADLLRYVNSAESIKELSPYANRNCEFLYYSTMTELLSKFEGEVDLGEGFGNSKEFSARLKSEQSELLKSNRLFTNTLKKAPPEAVDQYFAKRALEGERSAQTWLNDEFAK